MPRNNAVIGLTMHSTPVRGGATHIVGGENIHAYAHTHIHNIHTYIHTLIHTYTHVHTYTPTHIYTYTHMGVWAAVLFTT